MRVNTKRAAPLADEEGEGQKYHRGKAPGGLIVDKPIEGREPQSRLQDCYRIARLCRAGLFP